MRPDHVGPRQIATKFVTCVQCLCTFRLENFSPGEKPRLLTTRAGIALVRRGSHEAP